MPSKESPPTALHLHGMVTGRNSLQGIQTHFLAPDQWENLRVGPGDKVLPTGFFIHYAGAHQFQPIFREGSLAMIPDDAMPGPLGAAKVYLVHAPSHNPHGGDSKSQAASERHKGACSAFAARRSRSLVLSL